MALEVFQDKAELKIQDPSVISVTVRNYEGPYGQGTRSMDRDRDGPFSESSDLTFDIHTHKLQQIILKSSTIVIAFM